MGQIIVKTKRLQMRGGEGVDFQAIRDDNGVDPEYHAFMTIEGLYMIVKIESPVTLSILTYHLGSNQKNREVRKRNPVEFETAWTGRAGLTYVRYDKILETFFT